MALRRAITKRLIKNQSPATGDKPLTVTKFLTSPQKSTPEADAGFFRRVLQRRKINQSSAMSLPELFSFLVGEKLREKMNVNVSAGERLRLDGLKSPATVSSPEVTGDSVGISVNDARKILRFSQLQKVRSALKQIQTNSISYSEFVTVCIDCCGNHEQGVEFSKMLDEAGDVIVLGNIVFLRPDQLAKSMEKLISQSIAIPNDPRKQELEKLEMQKALIDKKSLSHVRAELYGGLGFLVLQTLGFMRLTFWELSWDVMEPICFFVTSFHFALAYMFFIKTSKEPTFEGYFQRRFKTKQRKLMEMHGFDLQKYNDLCKAFYATHESRDLGSSRFQDLSRRASSNIVFN
ncbi:calcium uniporter protein 5, mitochondrial-like [Bidens hawaiensis]|uniref:calcium uniporter protein 5, mitochondrial-like n=1 Tax=Bidens hawaiensis TaxID=980011 RepID=UPI004049D4B9